MTPADHQATLRMLLVTATGDHAAALRWALRVVEAAELVVDDYGPASSTYEIDELREALEGT